jgi:NTE family protein
MPDKISNLIFEGAGVLGIAYLGVLDYLYRNDLMKNLERTAGTSSGAIAACITSFRLPFEEVQAITESLDYNRVPERGEYDSLHLLPEDFTNWAEPVFGDLNCLYRLITRYGWYSSEYFYRWIRKVIADRFNNKKEPPYTFQDFRAPDLHKDNRPFLELFITGTNLTTGTGRIFSYETTPMMEVAAAVRISMSIPLFFESIEVLQYDITGDRAANLFCDGGVLNNYPLRLFDAEEFNPKLLRGVNMETLGVRFMSRNQSLRINNLLDYIWGLALSYGRTQQEEYYGSPMDRVRSINIDSLELSPVDFNISPGDETYRKLYSQGYLAAEAYFLQKPP